MIKNLLCERGRGWGERGFRQREEHDKGLRLDPAWHAQRRESRPVWLE